MYNVIPEGIDKDIVQCVTLKIILANQNQIVQYIQVSQRKEKENRNKKMKEETESNK